MEKPAFALVLLLTVIEPLESLTVEDPASQHHPTYVPLLLLTACSVPTSKPSELNPFIKLEPPLDSASFVLETK